MAKLPENIRKPGGNLVSLKRPHGPRLLLPAEVELCKLLNLTEDEYWYFVDTTAAYNGTRPKSYQLIPDIQAGTVLGITISKQVLIQIGIAIVAATVSYLLTPKPKEMKQGGSRRTADAIGNKRFAPQATFDSIQELAILGDAIPLIFANTDEKAGFGGIRVNSQLLWSQFLSMGKYQQLKVLALFSLGEIPTQVNGVSHPNYEGFGIGDTLLNTYNSHKVGLYFRNGKSYIDDDAKESNRVKKSERYSSSNLISIHDDPFVVEVPNKSGGSPKAFDKNKAFSGSRNPSTQITFGVFAPVPNAQIVKLPYELVSSVRGTSKEAGWDNARKRKKVEFAHWPTRAGIIKVTRGSSVLPRTTTAPIDGLVGDIVDYQITGIAPDGENNARQMKFDTDPNTPGYQEDPTSTVNHDAWGYKPHGVDDVDSMTISIRENADSIFVKGEQYLFGTAVMKCIGIADPVPYHIEKGKSYQFEIIEKGKIDIPVSGADLGTHCNNPDWYDPGSGQNRNGRYSLSERTPILYKQIISGVETYNRGQNDLYHGHDIYTCQKIAFATVSNNRNCDVTEIGIKSKVFKQMRFSNVNSQPGQKALDRAYNDRTQIQLGQVDRYLPRMSFFMLQVRKIGGTIWYDMKNGVTPNHTGLFAVRGNSPEFQYNSIAIQQENGQFEYRFKPYPGNYFTRGNNFGKEVNVLEPATDDSTKTQQHFSTIISGVGGFNVLFTGNEAKTINEDDVYVSNNDWNIEPSDRLKNGLVQSAKHNNQNEWKSHTNFNGTADIQKWVKVVDDDPSVNRRIAYWDPTTNVFVEAGKYHWVMYYDGTELDAKQTPGGDPGPGVGNWQQVYFYYNNRKFTASQNTGGGHPENKYYLFYVDEWEWQTIEPTPFFEGVVDIVHGQSIGKTTYVGNGVAGSLKINLKVYKDNTDANNIKYHATWTIHPTDRGENYDTAHSQQGLYIPNTVSGIGQILPEPIQVQLQVGEVTIPVAGKDLNKFDVIKDWNIYEGDINSNKNEPEHQICFVNEIVNVENDAASAKYLDLAHAGLVINSSKEWTNFSQFSAYFKQGIEIERLITSGTGSSNLFPEIAYALLTSTKIGAGKLVGTVSVDKDSMEDAAKFCKANDFFWDGVISSKLNLRDFIFEHAGYCLLDFTIIGGKFSLKPTVPVNGNFEIDKNKKPDIKCLFTDGNINDLQVSFLSPEERQLFRAAVLFRKETPNGFPETKSVLVTSDSGTVADPLETFDMSGFCTSSKQAITFAKYAINLRRLSDHGITFKTAPQYIQSLGPGDYFRLVSEVTHTTRFRNGAKLEDGTIVSKDDMTGNEDVLYWMPGTEGQIMPSKLSAAPAGCLFTVKNATTENKVYKCETISYGEEGLIEVSGSYAPTEANTGYLSVLQNWDTQFTVQED
jgi:hypothetical protein